MSERRSPPSAFACYSCKQELLSKPAQLPSGQWTVNCENCGITNKLKQDSEMPDRFSVSGAFFNIKLDDKL